MQIKKGEILRSHTSMRVGGPADELLIPEDENELVSAFSAALDSGRPYFILGRGSNVIFCDQQFSGTVIKTGRACTNLEISKKRRGLFLRRWRVHVGTSVTNQSFIRFCAKHDLEAPTYLQSVPGNIGGAVAMNAGTGIDEGQCISDRLVEVKVFDGQRIRNIPKDGCEFGFRYSVFHERPWLILSAVFELPAMAEHKVRELALKRMEFCRKTQDLGYPNAGSVFKLGYVHLPEIAGHQVGQAMFSKKAANWIVNLGGARASDILALVYWSMRLHERSGYPLPVVEWDIVA